MLLLTNQMRGIPESLKFPRVLYFWDPFPYLPALQAMDPSLIYWLSTYSLLISKWRKVFFVVKLVRWSNRLPLYSPRLPLYLSYLIQGTLGILMITQRKTGDQPHLLVASFWSRLKIFNRRDFTCFSQPGEVCLTLYVLINVSIWETAPLPHPWPTLTLTWYRGLVLRYWNWSRSFHKGAKLVWLM